MDDGIYCCIKNTSFDLNNKNDTRHCDIIAQKQFHSHINGRKREKRMWHNIISLKHKI